MSVQRLATNPPVHDSAVTNIHRLANNTSATCSIDPVLSIAILQSVF